MSGEIILLILIENYLGAVFESESIRMTGDSVIIFRVKSMIVDLTRVVPRDLVLVPIGIEDFFYFIGKLQELKYSIVKYFIIND